MELTVPGGCLEDLMVYNLQMNLLLIRCRLH